MATVAIGKPGATNAGVLAAQMLALGDAALATRSRPTSRSWKRRSRRRRSDRLTERRQVRSQNPEQVPNVTLRWPDFGQLRCSAIRASKLLACPGEALMSSRRAAARMRRGCRGRGSSAPTRRRPRSARMCANALTRSSRRPLERNAGRFVERQQVHLGLQAVQQAHQSAGVVGRVVDAGEHHVLERDAAALARRETGGRRR